MEVSNQILTLTALDDPSGSELFEITLTSLISYENDVADFGGSCPCSRSQCPAKPLSRTFRKWQVYPTSFDLTRSNNYRIRSFMILISHIVLQLCYLPIC